jgi:glycosyltransferase involved in cell wall biosynthesis
MSSQQSMNPWLHSFYNRYRVDEQSWDEKRPLKICFLVGSADISGGSYVIFEHALYAQRAGHDVTIATLVPLTDNTARWHAALDELKFTSFENAQHELFDLVIATWWKTVFEVPKFKYRHAVYFVQSVESRFYTSDPDPNVTVLSEMTYTLNLPIITIASWLQAFLALEHSRPSLLALNGIDKEKYSTTGKVIAPRAKGRLRVLLEGPIDVKMKGVPDAIQACKNAGVEEVWLLTSSAVKSVPGVDRVFSRVASSQTGEIFRSCDVLVKLSQVEGMYGPPLEMFHCGGTVVTYDVTGSDEYVIDGHNGLIVSMDDVSGVSNSLLRLKQDPELVARLQQNAVTTANKWLDWNESSSKFLGLLVMIAKRPAADGFALAKEIFGASVLPHNTKGHN